MTTSTALAKKTVSSTIDMVKIGIQQNKMVFPKGWDLERFERIVVIATKKNPKLLECAPRSLIQATLEAAQLGLEPDGLVGDGYLIPRKGQAVFQIGYKGLAKLAKRSGEVKSIMAGAVHANDDFCHRIDASQPNGMMFFHEVAKGDRGEFVAAWAMAVMTNGGVQVVVLSKAEVDAARAFGSGSSPAWTGAYDEMAKKTAKRKLCKDLPASAEDQRRITRVLEVDDALDAGRELPAPDGLDDVTDVEVEPAPSKLDVLNAALPAL